MVTGKNQLPVVFEVPGVTIRSTSWKGMAALRAPERWRTFPNPNGAGSHRLLPELAWSGGSRHSWGLGTCAGL